MREIKFRAWHKKNERFIQWKHIINMMNGLRVCVPSKEIKKPMTHSEIMSFDDTRTYVLAGNVFADKDLFDMSQFTGKKDKNGKEVYYKDIVQSGKNIGEIKHGTFIVNDTYDCGETEVYGFYIHMKCFRKDGSFYFSDITIYDVDCDEVVGNIYENPELVD